MSTRLVEHSSHRLSTWCSPVSSSSAFTTRSSQLLGLGKTRRYLSLLRDTRTNTRCRQLPYILLIRRAPQYQLNPTGLCDAPPVHHSTTVRCAHTIQSGKKKCIHSLLINIFGLSPRVNYTDRAAAAGRRS
jgi:hypothetical protein